MDTGMREALYVTRAHQSSVGHRVVVVTLVSIDGPEKRARPRWRINCAFQLITIFDECVNKHQTHQSRAYTVSKRVGCTMSMMNKYNLFQFHFQLAHMFFFILMKTNEVNVCVLAWHVCFDIWKFLVELSLHNYVIKLDKIHSKLLLC